MFRPPGEKDFTHHERIVWGGGEVPEKFHIGGGVVNTNTHTRTDMVRFNRNL